MPDSLGQQLDVTAPVRDHLTDLPQPRLQGRRVYRVELLGIRQSRRQRVRLTYQCPVELQQLVKADVADPVPDLVLVEQREPAYRGGGVIDGPDQPVGPAEGLHDAGRGEKPVSGRAAGRRGSEMLAGGNGCSRVEGGTRSARHRLASSRSRALASPRPRPTRSLTSRSSARSRPRPVYTSEASRLRSRSPRLSATVGSGSRGAVGWIADGGRRGLGGL